MGLDSVEIILCWEESLGISIPDDKVSEVTTPNQSIDLICSLMSITDHSGPSLSMLAFYKVRSILVDNLEINRNVIKPNTKFSQIFPHGEKKPYWLDLKKHLKAKKISHHGWPFLPPGKTSIWDVVIQLITFNAKSLMTSNSNWSRSQIREVVHASIIYVAGVKNFSDDDHYIYDIGID